MAIPTNAQTAFDVGTPREDLGNMIYDITPTEFPVMSMLARGKSKAKYHEWPTHARRAASVANAHIDGDEFAGDASTNPVKEGNHCQIFREDIVVSGRADAVDKAGRGKEIAFQLRTKSEAVKSDIELTLCTPQASVTGNTTTAPKMGTIGSWIKTNDIRGSGGAAGGYASGAVSAPTNGTAAAMTETNMLTLLQECWTQGQQANRKGGVCIIMGAANKTNFSSYMFSSSARIATPYKDEGKGSTSAVTAIGAVDLYVGDFGVYEVIPSRYTTDRDVYVIQKDMMSLDYLRPWQVTPVARTGDSEKRMILADLTLKVHTEKSHGIYADVDHTTAMVA